MESWSDKSGFPINFKKISKLTKQISDGELVGQIGDGDADHAWWGRPEEMTMNRFA